MFLSILIMAIVVMIMISLVVSSLTNGITPTPTSHQVRKEAVQIAMSYHPESIADFGAGWGTMAFAFAKAMPNTSIYAYERSFFPYLYMKIRSIFDNSNNVTIYRKDYNESTTETIDLIYCYLYTQAMQQLSHKLKDYEGTILSNTFALPHQTPTQKRHIQQLTGPTTLYIYSTVKH